MATTQAAVVQYSLEPLAVELREIAIPETNMADFQAKCAAIASAATESLASSGDDATETGSVVAGDAANTSPDLANKDNLDELLASLTPEIW